MNAIMEQYLWAYINYQQDNWVLFLASCEFEANKHFSETLKYSPFLAKYGWNPWFTESPHPLMKSQPHGPAADLATQLTELHVSLPTDLNYAQIRK